MKHNILGVVLVVALVVGFLVPLLTVQSVMAAEEEVFYPYKDTYISRTQPTSNYYDETSLWASGYWVVGEDTFESKAILQFNIDWGVDIPDDAGITLATLRLYYKGKLGVITLDQLFVYRMLRADWYQTSATWNEYKFGSSWTTAGGWGVGADYTTANYVFAGVPSSYGWMEWTITSQIQWAQSNNENVFVIIGYDGEWDGECQFYSKDYLGTTHDPQLVVRYIPATVPPTVSTITASPIVETSATLHGYLDDDGNDDCSVRFQYGTTIAYGSITAWDAGHETGDSFNEIISGLDAGTTYHFRAQAINGLGTVTSGDDELFTTLPYEPYNFVATGGDEEVELTWSKGSGADKTMIRRSTTSYPNTPSSGAQVYFNTGASHTDSSLDNGTTYYYSAWSWANEEYSSDDVNDSATPSAPAAPDCTTNEATNVGTTSARLNMYLDALNGAASATVSLEYYKEGGTPWEHETSDSVYYTPGTYYADVSGLDESSTYYVRAKAVSSQGTGYGGTKSFTTGGTSAPTMTTQSATGVMRVSATLNGEVTADGDGSVTAWFEWGLSEVSLDYETASISGLITDDTFYYGLSSLDANTTYYYRALGENSVGIGYGAVFNFTTDTAPAPTVRTDNAVPGANQANLYGTVLTDGDALCEVRFQWGLNVSYGYNTTWLPNYEAVQSFNQLITGLDITTTYHYRAQAKNEGGMASGEDETFVTVFTPPTDFRAKAISHTTINLEWTRTGDMTLVKYQTGSFPIDRDAGAQCYFGTGTVSSVSGLEAGTSYYFRAWSWREGNVWAANYTEDVATTFSAGAPEWDERTETVTTPDTPERWFQIPSGERLQNMPLYDQFMSLADSYSIPEGTWWFGVAVVLMLVVGVLMWRLTRRAAIGIILAGFMVVVCAFLGMMPLWFLIVYIALAGGLTFVSQRV